MGHKRREAMCPKIQQREEFQQEQGWAVGAEVGRKGKEKSGKP